MQRELEITNSALSSTPFLAGYFEVLIDYLT